MAEEQGPIQPEVIIQPEQLAGVWANYAQVSHSPYEFTLDFVRLQFGDATPRGIVVARVSVSPLFVTQLIQALQTNWTIFAEKAMPKEVYLGDQGSGEGSPAPEDEQEDDDNNPAS